MVRLYKFKNGATKNKRCSKDGSSESFFPGYIDRVELKEAYSGCDLFLFLTYEETEGIVLLEALASEIPVLLRDISIYKIFSTDKKVVYKADDFKSFQKKTELILNNNLPNLTENARKVALEYDLKAVAQKLKCLYETVL